MDNLDKTFVKAFFTGDYYRGYRAVELYVAKTLAKIIDDAGAGGYLLEGFRHPDELIARHGWHAQSKPVLSWAMRFLAQSGFAMQRGGAYRLAPDISTDTVEDARQVLGFMPSADIFLGLLDRIGTEMPDFLSGRKAGGEVLFSPRNVSLWNDYFNNRFYGYSLLNYGAAYGIGKWFSGTRGKRMLELGSGTSGATIKVFEMLRDNNLLDGMESVILTDAFPQMLEIGRGNIRDSISPQPGYEQAPLDINMPFAAQGIKKGHYDIVFGVNVLHVARDLGFSLNEIRSVLRKDGVLVISETIRPEDNRAMHHEIIFNLLPNYYDVRLAPEMRPYHGFLTIERWKRNLEAAGFSDVDYIAELASCDQVDFDIRLLRSALVIKGRK